MEPGKPTLGSITPQHLRREKVKTFAKLTYNNMAKSTQKKLTTRLHLLYDFFLILVSAQAKKKKKKWDRFK
jgi:hypothetical protein